MKFVKYAQDVREKMFEAISSDDDDFIGFKVQKKKKKKKKERKSYNYFSSRLKDLAGMYPWCMIVGSSGEGMVLPQEGSRGFGRAPGTTERERLCIVQHARQKFKLKLVPQ
ncbi:hypothetical protein TNCV_1435981 [Trichonephila clavipes]|nr:hypothetical protein TNCV_1435981 [Trichonephila clavipes]